MDENFGAAMSLIAIAGGLKKAKKWKNAQGYVEYCEHIEKYLLNMRETLEEARNKELGFEYPNATVTTIFSKLVWDLDGMLKQIKWEVEKFKGRI